MSLGLVASQYFSSGGGASGGRGAHFGSPAGDAAAHPPALQLGVHGGHPGEGSSLVGLAITQE